MSWLIFCRHIYISLFSSPVKEEVEKKVDQEKLGKKVEEPDNEKGDDRNKMNIYLLFYYHFYFIY